LKTTKLKEGECPYLEPGGFITYMKCLSSELKNYNIKFDLIKDFDYKGGFGVSIEESMAALRHTSVSAHRQYQKRNFTSEMNRYKALGLFN